MSTSKCRYARAAIASARAGLDHIRQEQPHSYLALFMILGLVTNTRHVWHALANRDREEHTAVIDAWMKNPPAWTKRLQPLLNTARDLLLKEWMAIPQIATGNGRYEVSMYIPAGPKQEAVMSDEERRDREDAISMAEAMDHDTTSFAKLTRIDVLGECQQTLDFWDAELDALDQKIASASA